MSLDERQRTVKEVFTREQLKNMSVEDIRKLVGDAGPGTKIHITAVVKKANGVIRYSDGAVPGDYNETPEEMAAYAAEQEELKKGQNND